MSPDVCVASPRIGTNTGVFPMSNFHYVVQESKHSCSVIVLLFVLCSRMVVDVFDRLLGLGQNVSCVGCVFMSRHYKFTRGRCLNYCAVIAVCRPLCTGRGTR